MKKILGLDLGTNSIGAALINIPESINDFGKEGNIEWLGSRIVPVDAQYLNKWSAGAQAETKAAARRIKRGSRRLKHRYKLRRTRLIQVFKILGWLDESFPENFKTSMVNIENFKFRISDYLPFEDSTIETATNLLGRKNKKGELTLPEDWVIYYLRKKALTEIISFAELARITYMMNQRRGFKSSRKDLKDENINEIKWVDILKIKSITQETFEKNKNGNFKFTITPYSDRVQPWIVEKKKKPDWEEKDFTFLITEKSEIKNGKKITYQNNPQIPKPDDWALCVTAQDNRIGDSYPGTYFFYGLKESIQNNTNFKIRQYAVYRKKYKQELEDIWRKQIELNDDLKELNTNKNILRKLAEKLYPTQTIANKPKLNEILSNDLLHLISEDIIYYQRDLKSQRNSRGECQYETHKGIDGELYGIKCTPKSSPEFQEFRIWQDIHNIKILQKNGTEIIDDKKYAKVDIDITEKFIDDFIKGKLFELFNRAKEVSQQNIFDLINKLKPEARLKNETHRINMFFNEEKRLQGNETKNYFRKIFKKEQCNYEEEGELILNDKDKFYKLWSISYSISLNDEEKSREAIFKALTNKENKTKKAKKIAFNFPPNVAHEIAKAPDVEATKKYASYSSKAINKLLPLMRCDIYYISLIDQINTLTQKLQNETQEQKKKKINNEIERLAQIENRSKEIDARLETINYNPRKINEVADDDVQKQLLKSFISKKENLLTGLNTYQACYLTYDRHSERANNEKYSQPSDFNIMEKLPNNSLRNPVVEQVIREALFLVKDVWDQYGQPDEIHIEMGRDLKKNAEERKRATEAAAKNFDEKQRIKKLLYELLNDGFEQYIQEDDVTKVESTSFEIKPNPESPIDVDKFKIWKSTAGLRDTDFDKIIKDEKIPKQQEIKKYVLWLSQKCVSPYTGKIIPLSKLFDPTQYEIEHVLPKAKIKNDSYENLVIAEWGVNKAKSNDLGAIFIKGRNGACEYGGKKYKLFDYDDYVTHCKNTFKGKKLQNLLATEIPEDFISRQINDTRYITKKISELLYPVAKGKKEANEGAEKGGIVFTIGAITSELKREWGLQKEWKKIVKPRFERLEKIKGETYILENKKDRNDIDFNIKENENLDIKRIDHRHHAMDALIIAATTIEHIRYINSLSSVDSTEEERQIKRALVKGKIREFQTPWPSFTEESRHKLEECIVTYKSYNHVITKPQNKYTSWEDKSGKWEKVEKHQEPNKNWMSVRKSMFKEPQGLIFIKEIITKSFRTPKEMLDIVKLQMNRMNAQNTSAQKNTSYIYDQDTRDIIKQIIELSNRNIEAIEKYLKKFKPKNINGEPIYTVRIAVFKEFAAKRVALNKDFDHKKIDKIPYSEKSRIPLILHQHLLDYEKKKLDDDNYNWNDMVKLSKPQEKLIKEAQTEAFSDEGLEVLAKENKMKISMVTIKEDIGIKISLQNKLVEADGNPYYIMYENIFTKERTGFSSLSAYDVIQKVRSGDSIAKEKDGYEAIVLSTNDLVYVPTKDELEKIRQGIEKKDAIDFENKKEYTERIYRVNDFSKSDIYFKPNRFSLAIMPKELHTSFDDKCSRLITFPKKDNNGNDIQMEDDIIKDTCIKLKVDRLGNIQPA